MHNAINIIINTGVELVIFGRGGGGVQTLLDMLKLFYS